MQPLNRPLQRLAHLERVDPVVGRPGGVLRQRADEGALLDARHVAGVRPRVVAARPEVLVQLGERAALDHLRAQGVVLLLRAVHPVHGRRAGQVPHLLHPAEQVGVVGEGYGRVPVEGHGRHAAYDPITNSALLTSRGRAVVFERLSRKCVEGPLPSVRECHRTLLGDSMRTLHRSLRHVSVATVAALTVVTWHAPILRGLGAPRA